MVLAPQMQVPTRQDGIQYSTNATPTEVNSELIQGFIDYLNGTRAKEVSSETIKDKEVSSKAGVGEDKELIENITKLLSNVEKNKLDLVLEQIKELIENPQSNKKLIEKDAEDKIKI